MSTRPPEFDFTGKVAVVTGAASGIAFAVSAALAAEGASVVLADVDDDALRERGTHLASRGHDVHHVRTDVSDPDAVEALAAAAVDRLGIDAIRRNRPYVYSDRDGHGEVEDRFARILSARDDVIDGQE